MRDKSVRVHRASIFDSVLTSTLARREDEDSGKGSDAESLCSSGAVLLAGLTKRERLAEACSHALVQPRCLCLIGEEQDVREFREIVEEGSRRHRTSHALQSWVIVAERGGKWRQRSDRRYSLTGGGHDVLRQRRF